MAAWSSSIRFRTVAAGRADYSGGSTEAHIPRPRSSYWGCWRNSSQLYIPNAFRYITSTCWRWRRPGSDVAHHAHGTGYDMAYGCLDSNPGVQCREDATAAGGGAGGCSRATAFGSRLCE